MGWLSFIATVLQMLMEVWRSRADPDQARLRAAARATEHLAEDRAEFNKALVEHDAEALSRHFQLLADRAKAATVGRGGSK